MPRSIWNGAIAFGAVTVPVKVCGAHGSVCVEELDGPTPKKKPGKREVEMAGKLVEGLATDFGPDRYHDSYRERVLALVKRKAKGEEIEVKEPARPEPSDDLLPALQASLDAVGGNGKPKKSGARRKKR